MKLGVSTGGRYHRVGEEYYTSTSFHAEMWKECLEVFDEVLLTDRVVYSDKVELEEKPVLTESIRLLEYPNYDGAWSMLRVLPRIFWRARKYTRQADVWHLHCVHFETFCTWFWIWLYRIPYSLELRGDQDWDVVYLSIRGVRFPRLVSLVVRTILRLQMTRPKAIISVSKSLLRQFGNRNNCRLYNASNARIPSEIYQKERVWKNDSACRTIVCSGRLEAQKNPIGTVKALAKLDEKGFRNWKFVWIGDGPLKGEFQRLAGEYGLSEKIEVAGFVPWSEVFEILCDADLFLLNSVCEGLSRAVLEAMACALPVIGTTVGGWEEILSPEDAVPRMEDDMLAEKLFEVLTNPNRMSEMSRRNLKTAKGYSKEILRARKVAFYNELRTIATDLKEKKT